MTLILGIAASIVFYKFIEKGHTNFHVHKTPRVKELFINNTSYDVIYIGSSRTHTTISPSVVDSVTGLSSYNAGIEGGNVFEFKLTLEGYLAKHPPPKLVFLYIDPASLDLSRKMFFPIQYFDVLDNPVIRENFRDIKEYKLFFLEKLPFLRLVYYDDYTKSLAIRGLLGQNELLQNNSYEDKGFQSNGSACTQVGSFIRPVKVLIEEEGILKLQEMINLCKSKGIEIHLAYAPEFEFRYQETFLNFNEFAGLIDSLADKNNIPFHRDDSLDMRTDPCLFANYGHVNTQGAIEYSKILGKRISGLVE